jgi:hypothetical protein
MAGYKRGNKTTTIHKARAANGVPVDEGEGKAPSSTIGPGNC